MSANTTYNPESTSVFIKTALNYDAIGISGIATFGTSTNIDLKITQDMLLTGAQVLTNNSTFGDFITFQVVDVDGILTTPNTILNQFVTNWQLRSDSQEQIKLEVNYPAKIYNGLYLRLIYTSIGTADIKVATNYSLHKILI